MAKKLSDIAKLVDGMTEGFHGYLIKILNKEAYSYLLRLSEKTNTYIFSGVIRNYFLGIYETRDIDIVLQKPLNIESVFQKWPIKKNSFGGYKIKVKNQNIDLWFLEDTWAIKKEGAKIGFDLEHYIPYTAFFNFSAISYSMKESRFYYNSAFLSFLRDKKISYVYEPNANSTLCIINTFYYSDKYSLKVDNKLMNYVIRMHKAKNRNYESVQMKHFGKVIYSLTDIESKISTFIEEIERNKEKRKSKSLQNNQIEPWLLQLLLQHK